MKFGKNSLKSLIKVTKEKINEIKDNLVFKIDSSDIYCYNTHQRHNLSNGVNNKFLSAYHNIINGAFNETSSSYSLLNGTFLKNIGQDSIVTGTLNIATSNSYFIIGNGTSTNSRSNCFYIQKDGQVYATGSYNTIGADYAEYFEWEDGNLNNEDRIGHFVSITENGKIKIAKSNEKIIGIISGNPSVIGNSHESQWQNMYLYDIYGRPIYEEIEEEVEYIDENNIQQKRIEKRIVQKVNPNYDSNKEYIPRSKRKEWSVVGLLGQIVVIDDGTCKVGEMCSCNDKGIATKGNDYLVIKRLDNNHIMILTSFLK